MLRLSGQLARYAVIQRNLKVLLKMKKYQKKNTLQALRGKARSRNGFKSLCLAERIRRVIWPRGFSHRVGGDNNNSDYSV